MKLKKPGLRIIKTFIAVSLAMAISYYRPGAGLPFYSAIAAIICLKSDVEGSRDVGKNRMIGTMLGGISGLIYLLLVPYGSIPIIAEYILISFISSLLIWVMSMAGKPKAITIMAVVFLSITINHGNEEVLPFVFAFNRTFDTMIGVVIAILVNWSDFEIRDSYNSLHQN